MGILDYLILAGIAVGILAAVRHLKRNSGCGGCVVSIKDGRYNIDNHLAEAIEVE